MSSTPVAVLTAAAIVTSAAVGGLFYAFSTFVMRGLDRTEPVDALTTMRGINTEAQANAPFLVLFIGSALLAVAVGVTTILRWDQPGSGLLLAGAILGVVGFVVTVAFNIPLNNHLDGLAPQSLSPADAATEWRAYLDPWTAWNHVRTAAGFAAAALMLAGLLQR